MIIGHKHILASLRKNIDVGRVAHAYLFIGPAQVGRKLTALEFVRMLNGAGRSVQSDALVIEPDIDDKESAVSIKQIRQLRRRLSLSSYGLYKAAVINQADRMSLPAANCLLKTLEEPLGNAVLILIAPSAHSVLPTISSRCQAVKFLPVPESEMRAGFKHAGAQLDQILRLANGKPGLAMRYLNDLDLLKTEQQIIHDLMKLIRGDMGERYAYVEALSKDSVKARWAVNRWKSWFRDLLWAQCGCRETADHSYPQGKLRKVLRSLGETETLLANPSINSRLALEVLMLEL